MLGSSFSGKRSLLEKNLNFKNLTVKNYFLNLLFAFDMCLQVVNFCKSSTTNIANYRVIRFDMFLELLFGEICIETVTGSAILGMMFPSNVFS